MIKSLSIASFNWKVLFKSLFCQVLVLVLILAFVVTVFGGLATDILNVITASGIADFIQQTVSAIIDGTFDSSVFTQNLNGLISNIQQNIGSIRHPWGGMTLSYILVFVTMLVYRLFVAYTDVTVACQIEEFMTSNAERPFLWFLLKKQGRTWGFICLQLVLTLPLDIILLTGSIGLYLLFLVAFRWWTIIPAMIILVLLYAARQTMFAFCLPSVVCEETSVRQAFKKGLSQIAFRFWHVFWKTLIIMCLMLVISLVGVMFVGNGWALTAVVTVPNFILFFVLKCVNFVEYFESNNRPYFHKRIAIDGMERYNKKRKIK